MGSSQPKIVTHGTWLINQSYPTRSSSQRVQPALESEFVKVIPNDYSFYSTLNASKQNIRVVILLPGKWDEKLACLLGETSLSEPDHPQYEALSYCWGDLSDLKTIDIFHGLPDEGSDDDNALDPANIVAKEYFPESTIPASFPGSRYYRQSYSITANLATALRYLRDEKFHRFLWIDAISINQSDVAEKTAQVAMMYKVYENAFQAVVWLDEGTEPMIVNAINFIYLLQDFLTTRTGLRREELIGPNGFALPIGHRYQLFDEFDIQDDDSEPFARMKWGLTACSLFFSLPWFRRVWVLQEIKRAPRAVVRCGHESIGWGAVLHAADWQKNRASRFLGPLLEPSELRTYFTDCTIPVLWLSLSGSKKVAMSNLLYALPFFHCTDPRDRLFSVLNLATETREVHLLPKELYPDYLKPVATVFADFVRGMLKVQGNLEILSLASKYSTTGKRQFLPTCPSWIPDFDPGNDVKSVLAIAFEEKYKEVQMEVGEGTAWDVLRLKGVVVDHISEIITTEQISASGTNPALLNVRPDSHELYLGSEPGALYKMWTNSIRQRLSDPYPTGEDLLTAFLTCLNCSFFSGDARDLKSKPVQIRSLNNETLADFAAYWKKYDDAFAELPEPHREKLRKLSESGSPKFLAMRLDTFCNGRCLVLTRRGLMGLAPLGAAQGDIIVKLGGGIIPYILRPNPAVSSSANTVKPPLLRRLVRTLRGHRNPPTQIVKRPHQLDAGTTITTEGSHEKNYEFIGECYVHGLMPGATIESPKQAGTMPLQFFDLV